MGVDQNCGLHGGCIDQYCGLVGVDQNCGLVHGCRSVYCGLVVRRSVLWVGGCRSVYCGLVGVNQNCGLMVQTCSTVGCWCTPVLCIGGSRPVCGLIGWCRPVLWVGGCGPASIVVWCMYVDQFK